VASAAGVYGIRVYDTHLAAVARLAGIRVVVTDDRRHFVPLLRYGIRVLSAAEFVEERERE
jgi:predicted nucleic acid-binding protein